VFQAVACYWASPAGDHWQHNLACVVFCLQRTATLNWPGLIEEGEGAEQPHITGDSSPRNTESLLHQSPRGSPVPLARPGSSCQAAADMEISHMLQQQAAQMSMKRAASGIMEGVLQGGGGKRHSGGTSGSPHTSGVGGKACKEDQGAAVWAQAHPVC
jgi:hypothetical protein